MRWLTTLDHRVRVHTADMVERLYQLQRQAVASPAWFNAHDLWVLSLDDRRRQRERLESPGPWRCVWLAG